MTHEQWMRQAILALITTLRHQLTGENFKMMTEIVSRLQDRERELTEKEKKK